MNNKIQIAYAYKDSVWEDCYISMKSIFDTTTSQIEIILVCEDIDNNIHKKFENLFVKTSGL